MTAGPAEHWKDQPEVQDFKALRRRDTFSYHLNEKGSVPCRIVGRSS